MSDFDLNIPNGTCWARSNVQLEDGYLPCGNVAAGGSLPCCLLGDKCLSPNACFHSRFGITYIAGCTDQDYSGPGCPFKGNFIEQNYVGLQRCDPDKDTWAGCDGAEGVVGDEPPHGGCGCPEDSILFKASPVLEDVAVLPDTSEGTIYWFPGHTPNFEAPSATSTTRRTSTTAAASVSAETTGTTQLPSGPTSTTTSSATPLPSSDIVQGLSTAVQAGIGVGAGLGALIIACLVIIAVLLRRRKKNDAANAADPLTTPSPPPTTQEPPFSPQPTLGPSSSASFAGFKSELPADEPIRADASPPLPTPTTPQFPQNRQWRAYHPGVHVNHDQLSIVSRMSSTTDGDSGPRTSPGLVSPTSTGGEQDSLESRQNATRLGQQSSMTPIHEVMG